MTRVESRLSVMALRGARVHAGRARDRFRAGVEKNAMLGVVEQRRVAVVGNADGERTPPLGLAQARHGERRRAARRQRDHYILGPDIDQLVATPDLIFRALDGLHHRRPAAGEQQDKPVARPAEGRHQLGAVLHGKPPGGSRPGVNEAAAGPKPRLHRQAGPLDGR